MKHSRIFKLFSILLSLCGLCDLAYIGYSLYSNFQIPAYARMIAKSPSGFVLVYGSLTLIAAAKLLASVFGFRYANVPQKTNLCLFLGSATFAVSFAGVWLSLSSSTPNVLLLCIGLIVSALYIACAALNGLGKEDGLQRAVGILFLGWSVLDASYAFYLLRILLSNYSFIASSYAAIGAEDLASITAAVYEAFLQVSIVSLLYFLAEVFTGIFAIRSCRAPKTAGVCIGLSVVVTALNTARLFLSHHDSLYLLAWGLFSVSLALSVLCVVSSVLLIRANRKSPQ